MSLAAAYQPRHLEESTPVDAIVGWLGNWRTGRCRDFLTQVSLRMLHHHLRNRKVFIEGMRDNPHRRIQR